MSESVGDPEVPGGFDQGPYYPAPELPIEWRGSYPPHMRKLDLEWSSHQEEGYHFKQHQATDQYGREWSWTIIDGQSGAEAYNIGYRDTDGIWHESSEHDGVLWDEWTDKNGNEHHGRLDPQGNWLDVWIDENDKVHQGFLADGEWVEWEPGIDLQGPWTQYTDSHGNVHHWATDQYGRKWDWYRDHHGDTNLGYTDQAGLWHRTYEGQDGTWYDRWTDKDGTQHVGFEKDGRWYERGPDGAFHDAADELLPPYIEQSIPLGSGANEDSNELRVFEDQYGRIWEWGRDAQGNANVGYTDKAGQWHDTYKQDGLWYDTWTDKDGNKHVGQVDQNGNVSDGWTDASGTNHDVVWPAGEELYGQEARWKKVDNQEQDNEDLDALFLERNDAAANLGTELLPEGGIVANPEEGNATNLGTGPIKDPLAGEWRLPEEDGVPPTPDEAGEEAALAPDDNAGDYMGLGEPYVDFIPTWPMVQDPITGGWRNAELEELGEIPELQAPAPNATGETLLLKDLLDPGAPGPTLDPALFDPNSPGPTLDPRLLLGPDSPGPTIDPALLDPMSPGPTLDPALFTTLEARLVPPDSPALIPGSLEYDPKAVPSDPYNGLTNIEDEVQLPPSEAGPTIDPALLDPAVPGPTLDPALLDPTSPGPTVDPVLLDENSPGPTIDPALLDPLAPGPTVDANLLDPMAPGPTVDPAAIDPATGQPLADPALANASFTDPALTDPSLTDPALTDPAETGQDLDGLPA